MAITRFMPIKTTSSNINNISIKEGQVIFSSDTGEGYVDYSDTLRLSIGSVINIKTEADRLVLTGMTEYKLYYTEDSKKMYSYDGSAWKCLNPDILTTFISLTDTPSSYTGNSGMVVKVNANEDGLVFSSPNTLTSKVILSESSLSASGKILALSSTGYVLADKDDVSKLKDNVYCVSTSNGYANIVEFGYCTIDGMSMGDTIYLGSNGSITNTAPTSGYVKVLGYMVSATVMKFKPDSYYKQA